MPTYYEIEFRNIQETEEIRRLGRLGFQVITSALAPIPYGQAGLYINMVILQRERAVPERGPIHDEYYNGDPSAPVAP